MGDGKRPESGKGASSPAEEQLAAAEAARARAERQAAQMRALLEGLGEAVVVLDAAGQIVLRNQAARVLSGVSDESVQALLSERSSPLHRLDGSPLPFEELPHRRALRGERFTDLELILVRSDGSRRRLVYSGSSILDESGKLALAIVVYRDVTELRQLRQLAQLQADFVRAISHDLRTPLTVILAHADVIGRWADDAERVRRSAGPIVRAAGQMEVMIQELVDSALLDSGHLRLARRPVDLPAFVHDLLERLAGAVEVERVFVEAAAGLPPALADPNHLERILVNLLSNALKYSAPGSEVRIALERGEGEVVVAVADHGPGIPGDELPFLFQRYFRTRTARRRRDGLGLGLYITKGLVEQHGGRIWAESQLGVGSTFRFTLPTGG